ncbi:MAG: hypothetical protein DSM106950_33095 [Stigonema ocellatum SAG 48.90 = DSM 106950]|nr:hypothetical protein [Stigonema ocellatum SAG 48.90 = DSM 106950]
MVTSQQALIESQRSLSQSMVRLITVQEQLAEQQSSSNAAVERLDRILDYLIRRDGAQ